MSTAAQMIRIHERTRDLAEKLTAEALAFAKSHGGYSGDNPLRYPFAFERVAGAAAARIAELEAWITLNGLELPESVIAKYLDATTTPTTEGGGASESEALKPPLTVVGEKEAHSHATRSGLA